MWESFMRLPEGQQRKFLIRVADDFDHACKRMQRDGGNVEHIAPLV